MWHEGQIWANVYILATSNSDTPIWNLANILITNNGSEISADTDS